MKLPDLQTLQAIHPQRALAVQIAGSGAYLPQRAVASAGFDQRWGKPSGWTAQHTGVAVRHWAGPGETSASMGAAAAKAALAAAGLQAGQLDCIVSACSVMQQVIPCLGSQIQQQLGLQDSGIPAFDINATCLSFLVALDQLACAIALGRYQRVLLVSSEMPSMGLNPDDPATAPLFGDGAAAVILTASGTNDAGSALLASHLETYSAGGEFCRFRAGGTAYWAGAAQAAPAYFEMDGRGLYKLAARKFPAFLDRLLGKAGLSLGDITTFVPHQASGKALAYLQTVLKTSPGKVVQIIEQHGNQVAASLPSALHHAISSGRVQRGDHVALLGTGAGLSIGGAVLRY